MGGWIRVAEPSPPFPPSTPGCRAPARPSPFSATGRRRKTRSRPRRATPAIFSPVSLYAKSSGRQRQCVSTGRWKTATITNATPAPGRKTATAIANPTPRSTWHSPAMCSWRSFHSSRANPWLTSLKVTIATPTMPCGLSSAQTLSYEPASQTPCLFQSWYQFNTNWNT